MNNEDFVVRAKARVCKGCNSFYGTPVLLGALQDKTIDKILINIERTNDCPECASNENDTVHLKCNECGKSIEVPKNDFIQTELYKEFLKAAGTDLVKDVFGSYDSEESIMPDGVVLGSCDGHKSFDKQQTLWDEKEEKKTKERTIH